MAEATIASFNLHWGRAGRALRYRPFDVVAVCEPLGADVLVLQESWAPDGDEAQHDAVARALGLKVVEVRSLGRSTVEGRRPTLVRRGGDGAGTGDWCLALLTRLPVEWSDVVALPPLRFDPVDRVILRAGIRLGERTLTLCATHLPHLEVGVALHTRALRAALPPVGEPGALVGDMNMWGWCLRAMAPDRWRLALRGRTYPSHRPHSQIDHLLVTPSVQVRDAEVVPVVASDHRPIRARVELGG